ncbi:hypothetical protein Cgig2_033805 [Carnegiea gigantea]|uniref:Uncharacterized protein n=1 Tax=Carnegiea gigantea TaxID=171969 RepID=A0A9Q1GKT3_9CARY|nr:hypothetical protein Cgig2_033805 [Carnegiea gigantea]
MKLSTITAQTSPTALSTHLASCGLATDETPEAIHLLNAPPPWRRVTFSSFSQIEPLRVKCNMKTTVARSIYLPSKLNLIYRRIQGKLKELRAKKELLVSCLETIIMSLLGPIVCMYKEIPDSTSSLPRSTREVSHGIIEGILQLFNKEKPEEGLRCHFTKRSKRLSIEKDNAKYNSIRKKNNNKASQRGFYVLTASQQWESRVNRSQILRGDKKS